MRANSNKISRVAIAFIIIVMLVMVRFFESELFYDPLLAYFKSTYLQIPLPEMNQQLLFLNITFRYSINSVLSLGLLYVIFRDFGMIKFTSVLYLVFFIILISIFLFAMSSDDPDKMLLFYIRRFLIQPIFILLFIPGFLFQEFVTIKPENSAVN